MKRSFSPQNYTKVQIAKLFKLKPGTTDRFDIRNRLILREYISDTIGEDQVNSINTENPIYSFPTAFYNDIDPVRTILHDFHNSQAYTPNWLYTTPADEIVFEIYHISEAVGCAHYLANCTFGCKKCENLYGCKYCHDGVEDHTFCLSEICCRDCKKLQNFSSKCQFCDLKFGEVSCQPCSFICHIGTDIKPFFHCNECGHCRVGKQDDFIHCKKCKRCIGKEEVLSHICKELGTCSICLDEIEQSNKGFLMPNCGHAIHGHCMDQLRGISCPVCRKTLLDDNRIEQIKYKMQADRGKKITPEIFCKGQCWDCMEMFVSPVAGVICQKCRFVNCERQDQASKDEYTAYKNKFKNFFEIDRVVGIEEALQMVDGEDILNYTQNNRDNNLIFHLYNRINDMIASRGVESEK
ncbi:Zinc finger domain-containing protein [Spironucleus salmonicida]|uniref:Zinc finger domain-containing protein n=1 Tax=Spironucleus salmonicida TaxID=348837 RepID=V6LPQ3_9EUKA|nr:Zinc finger domain-containing protein [Spironucleus salmonicida]|eukprot:EST45681.1 Zinc finger domain-containing protein [Spironucleus salmonicida]